MAINLVPKLVTEGQALGRITEELYLFDHFDGKVLDTSTEGYWNSIATGGGDGPTLVAGEVGGVIQFDPDSAANAVGGIASALNWRADQQGPRMIMEAKFKINTDLTNRYIYIGWSDDVSTAEYPVLLGASAAYGVTAATDCAGVVFHTVGHATNCYAVGVLNGVDVGVPTQIPGITLAAATWFKTRVEIDSSGNAFMSVVEDVDSVSGDTNDPDVMQVEMPLCVTATVTMGFGIWTGSVSAASATFYESDYLFGGGKVRAIAA